MAPGFPSLNLDRALLTWPKCHFQVAVLDTSQCRVHSQPRVISGSKNGLILLQSPGKHRNAWEEMERRMWGTQKYWEPLADAKLSDLYSSNPAFQRENLVGFGIIFPLKDPTTQGIGFSTVNLVSNFFFPSVLTD